MIRACTKGSLRGVMLSLNCVAVSLLAGCSGSGDTPLTVVAPNDLPVAADDAFTLVKGSTMRLGITANDRDTDNGIDPASIATISTAAHGSLDVHADGTVEYTHDGCGTVTDTFTYTISDASAAVSNAIDGRTRPDSVDARLLYQATQPGYVDGMHTVADRVNRFKVMYDAVPPSVGVLVTAVN